MEKLPLVSVLMPTYNNENTIEFAIKSLFYQTYKNWKCIIVNDGSTDETEKLLTKYEKDPRFKIIHLKENKGRGFARQVALENAEGNYVAFLDADDFYHPEKLQKQISIFELNNSLALVTCGQGIFNEKLQLVSVRGKGENRELMFELNRGLRGSYSGSMIRLDVCKHISYNIKQNSGEDKLFFTKYLINKKTYESDEVLYYYGEISATNFIKIIKYQLNSITSAFYYFRLNPIYSIKMLLQSIFKFLMYFIAIPVLGTEKILLMRGNPPTEIEKKEYAEMLKILNI